MADNNPKVVPPHLITQLGSNWTKLLTDRDLNCIATEIMDPDSLFPYLDISIPEMENIRNDSKSFLNQKFNLLVEWRRKKGNRGTLSVLIPILYIEMDDVATAEKICELFTRNQQQQQSVPPQHPPPPQQQEPPPDPMNNEPFEKKPKVTAAELEKEYEKVEFEDDDNQEIRKNPEVLIEVVNHTEFQAVISIMKGKISRHYIKDGLTNSTSTYCLGKVGDIQVVVVQTATRVGSQFQYGSWFETKKALHYFEKLKYIFAVGVCGAVIDQQSKSPRVPLGEVVISSHIIGYDHRKILDGNIEDRGYTEDLSHYDFYNYLQKLGNQGPWKNKIHFGKVLSGSWLVASLAAQHFLLHPDQPDKKAVEMEGVGIAAACKGSGIEAFLVVKGVSDYANSTKNDNWQPHAAKEAASFLSEMLNKYLKIRRSRET